MQMSGTLGTYALLAGQEQFSVNGGPAQTAILGPGGDPGNPWPAAVNPLATFWGYNTTSPFFADIYGAGGALSIAPGDTLTVSGFLDVLVDPGSVQVLVLEIPEPTVLSLGLLGGLAMMWRLRARNRR